MFKKTIAMSCAAACVAALGAASAFADEDTKVTGKMFADLTSLDQKAGGTKTDASGVGIDVTRFYVGIDHKFDDMWSANVTTDFNYVSNDGQTQVFIKKAYVQAKFSDAAILRAGSADLPWIPFVENLYGYRFIEKTLIDRASFGTSADWGINLNGKPSDMVNYSLSVVNGNGYKNPTRTKQMDLEGRVGVMPMEGLTLGAGFYSGKRGKVVESTPSSRTADRFNALVAYANAGLRVGGEYFTAKNWNSVPSTSLADKADGYSVWASYDFSPQYGVFARGDEVKPTKDTNPDIKDKYFNLGLVTHPRKNVDVALAYKNDKISGGTSTTVKTDEVGVWAQVVF